MKKFLGIFTIIAAISLAFALAQQVQPESKSKADSTKCGKHVVQVEKQKKCGDCTNGECCTKQEDKQQHKEKCQSRTDGLRMENVNKAKPAEQPKLK